MSGDKPVDGARLFLKQVNLYLLHEHIDDLVERGPIGPQFVFSEEIVLRLHAVVMKQLLERPGEYRRQNVQITHTDHVPPDWADVPRHMAELVKYVNDYWTSKDLVHLAAFVLWRLCWIHPFVNGNGRTARGTAYLVLSAKHGQALPPKNSIIEQIMMDKLQKGKDAPYYRVLNAVDKEHKKCSGACTCCGQMESLMRDMLKLQIMANL